MIHINGSFVQILAQWLSSYDVYAPELYQEIQQCSHKESISQAKWRSLLSNAASICPNDDIGIQIGAQMEFKNAGVLGYLVANSETLAEALENFVHGERHFYKYNFANLKLTEDQIGLFWPDRLGEENTLFVQVALSACYKFFRMSFGDCCQVEEVDLSGRRVDRKSTIEAYFGSSVTFNSTSPGIHFNRHLAEQKIPKIDAVVIHSIRSEQQHAFDSAFPHHNRDLSASTTKFIGQLQAAMLKEIPRGNPNLIHIAKYLDVSPRTLQRRLRALGISYMQILHALREQLSKRYLCQSELSLSEIALILGYSEQSAFQRAFKQWTGQTPQSFMFSN